MTVPSTTPPPASTTSDPTTTPTASPPNAGCATTSPNSPPWATGSPSNPPPEPNPHRHNITRLRTPRRVLSPAHSPRVFFRSECWWSNAGGHPRLADFGSRRNTSRSGFQTFSSRSIARPSDHAASHAIATVAPRFVPKSVPNTASSTCSRRLGGARPGRSDFRAMLSCRPAIGEGGVRALLSDSPDHGTGSPPPGKQRSLGALTGVADLKQRSRFRTVCRLGLHPLHLAATEYVGTSPTGLPSRRIPRRPNRQKPTKSRPKIYRSVMVRLRNPLYHALWLSSQPGR